VCEPLTIMTIAAGTASLVGGGIQAVSALQQGSAEAQVARNNAMVARWQARDALDRGAKDAGEVSTEGRRLANEAAAAESTRGVTTESNPFATTAMQVARAAENAKANAALEAWGFRQEARDQTARARIAKRQSALGALGAGLGGVGGALSALGDIDPGRW